MGCPSRFVGDVDYTEHSNFSILVGYVSFLQARYGTALTQFG